VRGTTAKPHNFSLVYARLCGSFYKTSLHSARRISSFAFFKHLCFIFCGAKLPGIFTQHQLRTYLQYKFTFGVIRLLTSVLFHLCCILVSQIVKPYAVCSDVHYLQ